MQDDYTLWVKITTILTATRGKQMLVPSIKFHSSNHLITWKWIRW